MLWWFLCYCLFAAACVPGIGVQPRCRDEAPVVYCGCDGPAPAEFLVTLSGVVNGTGSGASILNDTFVVVKREGCTRETEPENWCCYSFCLDNPDAGVEVEGTSGGVSCVGLVSYPKLLIVLWLSSAEGDPGTLGGYEVRVHTASNCCDPPYAPCDGYLEGNFLAAAEDADCQAVENLDLPYVGRTCHQYDLSGATCTISAV